MSTAGWILLQSLLTFTGRISGGLAPESAVTFTFIGTWQVHTEASNATDVWFQALVNI